MVITSSAMINLFEFQRSYAILIVVKFFKRNVMVGAIVGFRSGLRYLLRLIVGAIFLCFANTALVAAPTAPSVVVTPLDKHALILVSVGFGGPVVDLYVSGLVNGLKKGGMKGSNIYVEYLDLVRRAEVSYRQPLGSLLAQKYAGLDFDLVFCVQQLALNFLLNEGRELAPRAIILSRGALLPPDANIGNRQFVSQTAQLDYRGTLQLALALFPKTENVIVIQGSSEIELSRQKTIRNDLAPWQGKLKIEDTQGLSFEEIDGKLAGLPKNTILLGPGIARDSKGEIFVPLESNNRILKFAKAPYFVLYDSAIGSGSIGGLVSRIDDEASLMAALAIDMARGNPHLSAPVLLAKNINQPMFDWQQLQRWNADVSVLPANTLLINRPPNPWSQYKEYIIAGTLVILLLLVFVVSLILQNRRRRLAEARLRVLIEQAPEAILVVDVTSKQIINANPSAEKLFACSRANLLKSNVRRFYAQEQPDGLPVEQSRDENVARAMAGEIVYVERAMRSLDGHDLLCEVRLVRLPDAHRKLLRVSIVDITQRKQAESKAFELHLRLQALLDAAQEVSIIVTDAEGRITVFNHGAEKMFGYAASEMLGRSPALLHLPDEIDQCAAELTVQLGRPIASFLETFAALTRDGGSDIRNWSCVRKDGKHLSISLVVSIIRDEHGHITGFLCIGLDITERLAAEADLIQLNQQLDHRVQERTEALQTSTKQLQQALNNLMLMQDKLVQSEKLAALGSVVAGVAHELNTPIGNCMTVASTLQEKTEVFQSQVAAGELRRSQLDAYLKDANEAMQLLQKGLQRTGALVANFKQVAVDQSSAQRRQFMLKDAISGVVALMKSSLQKKPYRIELDIPDDLSMDSFPGAIEQIVSNLINNSVLHGFDRLDHGLIRLQARAEGEMVRIIYSDDGRGMSSEVQKHIFEPFFTTRLGTGGSGLGLSICYNLVHGQLGGYVDVSSVAGQGTTFTLVLPRVVSVSKT